MDKKFLAFVVSIVMAIMVVAPIMPQALAVKGPAMNAIQFRWFANEAQLFTALQLPDSAGGIDIMDLALTHNQYTAALNNPNICVSPYPQSGEYELAFNNNWTNTAHPTGRSAMNYTDFRNAMNCLVDKNGVIAGPMLQGFATRVDTQIPQPLMSGYVNPAVSYPNYPWEFSETHALTILYNGGWYNQAIYPTLTDLLTAFADGTLATRKGTTGGVVYPANDPNGQWGGSDPGATANAFRANTPIDTLMGYVRSGDARKDLGDMFCAELTKIGCPFTETYCATLSVLRVYVMLNDNPYDFATLGYGMGSPPNWWYTELTPAGIYSDGPNCYLVDDAAMTLAATAAYIDPGQAAFMVDIATVQNILVMESELVSVYSPASYCAYKTGMFGMLNELGYGFGGNGQLIAWLTMNCKKNNTISYTGDNPPESNIIYYGTYNPPDMANPIFANTVYDFQLMDNIWSYPIATNPYNTMVLGSVLTGVPTGGDLPWMAYSWKSELINDPTNPSNPQWTNVTYWFRHDITWHDGVPFDVNDLNYTIYINALYGDSWKNAAFMWAVNPTTYLPYFTRIDQWTCSVLVRNPSWLNLYLCNCEILPEHLYKYIVPDDLAAAKAGTAQDGLHGVWPGQAALSSNFLPVPPGAPGLALYITYGHVTSLPDYTMVGTGPWKYRIGSTDASLLVSVGGGCTLDAYPNFWMKLVPGETNFRATWLHQDGTPYSGNTNDLPIGTTYQINLGDLAVLASAFGTVGKPPSAVPISANPGNLGAWNPAADIAGTSGVVGLSDVITLALHYGWYWGNYSYNAPYPPAEQAHPP